MAFPPSTPLVRIALGVLAALISIPALLAQTGPAVNSIELTAGSAITEVYVNGVSAPLGANAANWKRVDNYGAVPELRVLAARCVNNAPLTGEAGFIGSIRLANGNWIVTDEVWKVHVGSPAADSQGRQWYEESYDDSAWRAATVDGEYGIPPWGTDAEGPSGAWTSGAPVLTAAMRSMSGGNVVWSAKWIWSGNASYGVSPVYFRRLLVPTASNPAVAPTRPQYFRATSVSATGANLAWNPSFAPNAPVSYEVFWNGLKIGTTTNTTFSASGMNINFVPQNYFYVQAVSASGARSQASKFLLVKRPDTTNPTPPKNVRITARYTNGFKVNWDPATDNAMVSSYLVKIGTTAFAFPAEVTGGDCTLSSFITPGTSYAVTVTTKDISDRTSTVATLLPRMTLPATTAPDRTAPTVPTALTVTPQSATSVTLGWNASTDATGVTGYRVFRNGLHIANVGGLTYAATGLAAGSSQYFQVMAHDAAGNESALTGAVPALAGGTIPPATPVLRLSGTTQNQIVLDWDGLDAGTVTSFTLRRWNGTSATGNSTNTAIPSPYTTRVASSSLATGSTYTYTLVANGLGGLSATSAPITVTTESLPTETPLHRFAVLVTSESKTANLARALDDAIAQGCTFAIHQGQHVTPGTNSSSPWASYMSVIDARAAQIPSFLAASHKDYQSAVFDPIGDEWNATKFNRFVAGTGFSLHDSETLGNGAIRWASVLRNDRDAPDYQMALEKQLISAEADASLRWLLLCGVNFESDTSTTLAGTMLQLYRPSISFDRTINGNIGWETIWNVGDSYMSMSPQRNRASSDYLRVSVYANRMVVENRTYSSAYSTNGVFTVHYDRQANLLRPGQVFRPVTNTRYAGINTVPENVPPWAQNRMIQTTAGTPVEVQLLGRSPRGAGLTYTIITPPAHGTLSGTGSTLTYTPAPGYIGEDVLIYRVSDGSTYTSNHAWARIEVTSPPIVVPPLITIDNNDSAGVTRTGTWINATSTGGYHGTDYLHDNNTAKGTQSVRFTPNLPVAGTYAVYLRWTGGGNRATNVPVDLTHAGGTEALTIDQRYNGGAWNLLGTHTFTAGTGGSVLIGTAGTTNYVIADAVRFEYITAPAITMDNNDGTGVTRTGTWINSTSTGGYDGSDYLHDNNTAKGAQSVRFTPTLPSAGTYAVYMRWTGGGNRATNVPVDINHASGTDLVTVDQRYNGGTWNLLGTYTFTAGTGGSVLIGTSGTTNHVIVDAVRFLRQ
jgi:hypothetical protein